MTAGSWVTPAAAILVLALVAVGLATLLLLQGHPIAALLLLVAAICQFGLSGEAARHRRGIDGAHAAPGLAARLRLVAAPLRRRRELRRLRGGLDRLRAGRAAPLQALGDAVYRGDPEASDEALFSIRTLDGQIAETEVRMRTIEAGAPARRRRPVHSAGLEPVPEPSPPIEPPQIPEPLPEPHVPPEIPSIPEPVPEPSEPWPAAGRRTDW